MGPCLTLSGESAACCHEGTGTRGLSSSEPQAKIRTRPSAAVLWQVRSVQAAERRADQELDRLMGDIGALLLDEPSPGADWRRAQSAVP